MKQNFMLDLETLGVSPGCTILSIGAVRFDETGVKEKFYIAVTQGSCERAGLVTDPDTVKWWSEQSPEAREAVFNPTDPSCIWDALGFFEEWLMHVCPEENERIIWGNGAAFDNAILTKAYEIVYGERDEAPWTQDRNNRCYRTVKALHPNLPMQKRTGTHHNALDDAISQAEHLITLPSFRAMCEMEAMEAERQAINAWHDPKKDRWAMCEMENKERQAEMVAYHAVSTGDWSALDAEEAKLSQLP